MDGKNLEPPLCSIVFLIRSTLSLASIILNSGIETQLIEEESCLLLLDDYHWCYILDRLSLVSKLNLSHTCRRFYELVNTDSYIIRFKHHTKKFYENKINVKIFIEDFCNNVQTKYIDLVEQADRVYLGFFCDTLKLELSPMKILSHLLWCRRNEDSCNYCSQVVRFCNETSPNYMNWSCYGTVWTKIIERVFYEEFDFENNNEHFENINFLHI